MLSLLQYYANNNQRFGSTKTDQRSSAPQQTAADDVQWPVSTIVDQQMAETTAGGVPYAVFKGNPRSHDKTKNKKVCTKTLHNYCTIIKSSYVYMYV